MCIDSVENSFIMRQGRRREREGSWKASSWDISIYSKFIFGKWTSSDKSWLGSKETLFLKDISPCEYRLYIFSYFVEFLFTISVYSYIETKVKILFLSSYELVSQFFYILYLCFYSWIIYESFFRTDTSFRIELSESFFEVFLDFSWFYRIDV